MRRPTRQVGCEGKTAFNFPDARRVAKAMRNQDKGRLVPYHCDSCGRWHIGNTVGGLPDRRRDVQKSNEE